LFINILIYSTENILQIIKKTILTYYVPRDLPNFFRLKNTYVWKTVIDCSVDIYVQVRSEVLKNPLPPSVG